MNKIKITSMLIGAIILSVSAVSMVGAVELTGSIEAEIVESFGLVKPRIQLDENQTGITLATEFDEATNYTMVNDTLSIKIGITDNSRRETFLIPRFVFASVVIIRKEAPIFPLFGFMGKGPGYLARLFPVKQLLEKSDISDPEGEHCINVTMNYWIGNETNYIESENLTMHLFTVGFFPGDVTGVDDIHFVDHKVINLKEISYVVS